MSIIISRRNWIRSFTSLLGVLFLNNLLKAKERFRLLKELSQTLSKAEFGKEFVWGIACASYQVEGASNGKKGEDIWDRFSHMPGKIKNGENGDVATDFYHLYKDDIALIRKLNFNAFRFSISWARLFPRGIGMPNKEGIDFYHRVIDTCLEAGIFPWITLYHWDLPQALEDKGGWTNREIIDWFSSYADFCTREYGDKVKDWMVLNEPLAFTGLGYMFGTNAPGKKGIRNFLPAAHHATLCQAEGGRIIRKNVNQCNVGTTFSCTFVDPLNNHRINVKAAKRMDAVMNRFFIEPALGMGYPTELIPALKRIEKYFKPGDVDRVKFDFDFIGIQNYFRTVSRFGLFPPFLWAKEIPATRRGVPVNEMEDEVSPEGFYKILKQFNAYPGVKKIIVTENGSCFKDILEGEGVHDKERTRFFNDYLQALLRAKREGVKVDGYFVWSLTDNFEWNEGFRPRFGVVYVDYETQKRYIKDSGYWFREFLK